MLTFGFKKELSVFALAFLFLDAFCKPNLVVEVGEKQYLANQKLTLKAGSYEICFRFPENQNKEYVYEYHLENLDQQTKTTIYPLIRYTNVTGGSYVFRVKIKENNQVVAEFIREIDIKENFWEKWWFWLFGVVFGVLAVGLLIYFWFLYDFRQRMKTEQIRQRIAADLHDEVGATLTGIATSAKVIEKKMGNEQNEVRAVLGQMTTDSQEAIHTIRDTIWALNPDNDAPEKLLEKMKSIGFKLLMPHDIAFVFENEVPVHQLPTFSMEQRRNLYLVYKEALHNIAKHSQATNAQVRIFQQNNNLYIRISDDGKGFDASQIQEGNGLKNFQKRAKEGGFDVKVTSAEGVEVEIIILFNHKVHHEWHKEHK